MKRIALVIGLSLAALALSASETTEIKKKTLCRTFEEAVEHVRLYKQDGYTWITIDLDPWLVGREKESYSVEVTAKKYIK